MSNKESVSKKAVTDGKYNAPFPHNLRALMKSRSITQVMIANHIGVTPQTVYQYANGISEPSYANLVKIATFFDTTTDYLLGRTNIHSQDANIENVHKYTGLSEEAIENLSGLYWKGSQFDIGENSAISAFIAHENFYEYVYQIAEAYRTLYRLKINEPYRKLDLHQEFHVDEQKIYHGLIYGASFILQNFIEKEVEKRLPSPATNTEKCSTEDTDNQEV